MAAGDTILISTPSINGHGFSPSYGHRFAPLADKLYPQGWPSVLPSALRQVRGTCIVSG
jgi:hypothetical protein